MKKQIIKGNDYVRYMGGIKKMKLSDLKTGMWVKIRNNDMYLVLRDYETKICGKGTMHNESGFLSLKSYDNDMNHIDDNSYDIIEVFKADIDGFALNKDKLDSIWKEKLTPKLTPFEIEFFKNIKPIFKWVAKDEDGDVWLYEDKPEKEGCEWYADDEFKYIDDFENVLTTRPFTWLKWEDKEPCYIPDLIKRCNI